MSIRRALVAAFALLGVLATPTPTPAHAAVDKIVWVGEDSRGAVSPSTSVAMPKTKAGAINVTSTALVTATTFCGYGQHTQKAIDWFTGATLASHVLRVDYCYNGSSIVGTPVITRHSTSVTLYGQANSISFNVTGQSGPSRISSYSWTATGYANYCQSYTGFSRCSGKYIIINPQGSGNYGWAEG